MNAIAMANRKGTAFYDDDDFDDGYDDDDYDDDYWGEDDDQYVDDHVSAPEMPPKPSGKQNLKPSSQQQGVSKQQVEKKNARVEGQMKTLAVSGSKELKNDAALQSLCDQAAAEE